MKIGKTIKIMALEVSEDLANNHYEGNPKYNDDALLLENICKVFKNRTINHKLTRGVPFTCYIEKKAFDAFLSFANQTYNNKRHEATGLIVGYYLHDPNNPESTFIVGTHFLEASGPTSTVTCELSYDDVNAHSVFYEAHKLLPLIWIHSHPGFGVFYSSTDSETLRKCYFAQHQAGVVVDNLQNQILGFKMYGDKQKQENIYIFDLDKSSENHLHLVYEDFIRNSPSNHVNAIIINDEEEDGCEDKEKELNYTKQTSQTEELSKETNKKHINPILTLILSFILVISAISIYFIHRIKMLDNRLVQIEEYLNNNEEVVRVRPDNVSLMETDSTHKAVSQVNDIDSLSN